MSFHTERPFFPYREPPEQGVADPGKDPPRLLRVFFLSSARVQGTLGEKGKAWPRKVAWANRLEADQRKQLLLSLKLPPETPPAALWLTEFEDDSSPRPGTADVYFTPSEDQSTREREPHIRYTSRAVPDCLMCYALAACMLIPCLVRHLRRKPAEGD